MKKDHPTSILDDIPKRTFDDSAMTVLEIAAEAGMSDCWARKLARENVASGLWEKVFKRVGDKVASAYRRAG